jgi:hypothetical protein
MRAAKFIQIPNGLYALDSNGAVWVRNSHEWRELLDEACDDDPPTITDDMAEEARRARAEGGYDKEG